MVSSKELIYPFCSLATTRRKALFKGKRAKANKKSCLVKLQRARHCSFLNNF